MVMLEIYVFVHPLCSDCLKTEKQILQLVQQVSKKVKCHFIPMLSLPSFEQQIQQKEDELSLDERNQLFQKLYQFTLDYKTIQLQGNRLSRRFMLAVQEQFCHHKYPYTTDLIKKIVHEIGADWETYRLDRKSPIIQHFYELDQQIAKDMGLTHHVGAVIFHYDKHMDFGIYTDEHPSYEVLSELILGDLTDKERHSFSTLIDKATHWQTTHCHLIEQKK